MTPADRKLLASALLKAQVERFDSKAKAAYTAAGVNPETWRRAVSGESIKSFTQQAIVYALWPETEGEWTKIPGLANGGRAVEPGPMEQRWLTGRGSQDLAAVPDEELLEELRRRLTGRSERAADPAADPVTDEILRDPEALERWLTDQVPEGESTFTPRAVVEAVVEVTRNRALPAEASAAGARAMDSRLRAAKKGQSSGRRLRAKQDADAITPDAPGNETGS